LTHAEPWKPDMAILSESKAAAACDIYAIAKARSMVRSPRKRKQRRCWRKIALRCARSKFEVASPLTTH